MPPPSGTMPRWMYDQLKLAPSLQITKSQARAVSAPSPDAAPFTAAITGLGQVCSRAWVRCTRCWRCQPLKPTSPAGAFMRLSMPAMSPPAQKALPAPVSTTARTARSAPMRSSASMNSLRIASLIALRLSGRLKARVAMPPCTCRSISS
jgi:hypothetical protein